MQYRPEYEMDKYIWCRSQPPADPAGKHLLPPDLFALLKGGVYSEGNAFFLATREYATEADATADLQQAAQALYFSQHQPAQYQNPF